MIPAQLQQAVAHHRAGRSAKAEAVCRQILATDENNADAWRLRGVLASERGAFEQAAGYFQRASRLRPRSSQPLYDLGMVLALGGRKTEAIEAYRGALNRQPALPEVRNNLGVLLFQAGQTQEAIVLFREAIAMAPAYAEAHHNLGLALWHMRACEEALKAFENAITHNPEFAAAHACAAAAYRRLGRARDAATAFRRAAAIAPDSSFVQREYGLLLLEEGDKEAALSACRRAVELAQKPADMAEAHHALGMVLASRGQDAGRTLAVEAYERALALSPEKDEWRFELAALRGDARSGAPDAFVRELFDAYAWKFEKHLVEDLGYRVPEELLAATHACAAQDAALRQPPWDILDLGCGTGRCSELFRGHARSTTGVDLAPNMIEASRRRGVYNALEEGHILPALQRRHEALDLILAADVFIYVGALEEVFAAARQALRPGGMLAFSIEHYEGEGFKLHEKYRFAHAPDYIRQLTARTGLTEKHFCRATLRTDVPMGWIVVLAK